VRFKKKKPDDLNTIKEMVYNIHSIVFTKIWRKKLSKIYNIILKEKNGETIIINNTNLS